MSETQYAYSKQTYRPVDLSVELDIYVWECLGCGSAVVNRVQHDTWHRKTRSIV